MRTGNRGFSGRKRGFSGGGKATRDAKPREDARTTAAGSHGDAILRSSGPERVARAVLAIVLCVGLMPSFSSISSAYAASSDDSLTATATSELASWDISGTSDGDSVVATLDSSGTLSITGTGDTADYSSASSVPWYSAGYASTITAVTIESTVEPDDLSYYFYGCENLTEVFSLPDSVTACEAMFYGCQNLIYLPDDFTIGDSVTTCEAMFYGCSSLVYVPDGFAIGTSVTSCRQMFYGCTTLVYLPDGFTVGDSVTDCREMFYSCTSLGYLPDGFTIGSSVTTCQQMFAECTSLKTLSDEFRIGESVTSCLLMFAGCTALASLPEGFTVPDTVTGSCMMMFADCESLTVLPAGFSIPSDSNTTGMFDTSSYSADNLLVTYCDEADYETLLAAYDWEGSYRQLAVYEEPEDGSTDVDLGFTLGSDYSTVSSDMGASPLGKTEFSLYPSSTALTAYRNAIDDSSATRQDMFEDWIASIESVQIDGVELSEKAFDEWKSELTNADDDKDKLLYYEAEVHSSYISIVLPVALFDADNSVNFYDTKTIEIEADGFEDVVLDLTYRNMGSDSLTVRVIDEDSGEVLYTYTFTDEELKSLEVQEYYTTPANCGMAGMRSYTSEGVFLTDIFEAAGVNFAEGMTMMLRVNDDLEENGDENTEEDAYISTSSYTYEYIMADRYYFTAIWDDETTYEELDGRTVYDVMSTEGSNWDVCEYADALMEILGDSAVQVYPLLVWQWSEGVLGWGGSDTTVQEYNGYCDNSCYSLRFGMLMDDEGNATNEATMMKNLHMVFGIDIIADESAIVTDPNITEVETLALTLDCTDFSALDDFIEDTATVTGNDDGTYTLEFSLNEEGESAGLVLSYDGEVLEPDEDGIYSLLLDSFAEGDMVQLEVTEGSTGETYSAMLVLGDDASLMKLWRIGGSTRYETAALEALEAYGSDGADTVIIATGENFPDSLAATSLAGALEAPILLTKTATLSDAAASAIEELDAENAIVIGGTSAVSQAVVDELSEMGLTVKRIYGSNRYKTAENIYIYGLTASSSGGSVWGDTVILASGADYADALSASSLAYAQSWPIFLVDGDGNASNTTMSIVSVTGASNALVLGGTSAVSEDVETRLESIFGEGNVTRLAGKTRYSTSVAIAEYAVEGGYLSWDKLAVASGKTFPDALAGSALQGADGSVILLVADGRTDDAATCLASAADQVGTMRIFGGEGAVSASVLDTLVEALGWDESGYRYLWIDD